MVVPTRTYFAENARVPHTAGVLIGASAFAFTLLFYPLYASLPPLGVALVASAMAGNAYCWTRVVWRRAVTPVDAVSRRRALATGSAIAAGSYLTVGVAFVPTDVAARVLLVENSAPTAASLGDIPTLIAYGTVVGTVGTFGIPLALSVAGTAWLVSVGGLNMPRRAR